MEFHLRPYQKEVVAISLANFSQGLNTILAMPVGTGKHATITVIVKEVIKQAPSHKIILIVKLKKLVYQYSNLFSKCNIENDIEILCAPKFDNLREYSEQLTALVIYDELEGVQNNLVLDVRNLFRCPVIVFSRHINPSRDLIEFFKGGNSGIDFRFSIEEAISSKELKSIASKSSSQLSELVKEIEGLDSRHSPRILSIVRKLREYDIKRDDDLNMLKYVVDYNLQLPDIKQLGFRKEQLRKFEKLLSDPVYFDNQGGNEKVWQTFFQENTWIFGYGLNFIFNEPLKGKKLEQTVEGFSIKGHGKRVDALMRSSGLIATFCFGEIKTHRKLLLSKSEYRQESWSISEELAGGIAQVQKTIHLSVNNLRSKMRLNDPEGYPIETIYMYKPKAFLLIGSLSEFTNSDAAVSETKHSSFELFRRSISDIEIITFDELLNRAKAIAESSSFK